MLFFCVFRNIFIVACRWVFQIKQTGKNGHFYDGHSGADFSYIFVHYTEIKGIVVSQIMGISTVSQQFVKIKNKGKSKVCITDWWILPTKEP